MQENVPDQRSEHGMGGKGSGLGFPVLLGLVGLNLVYVGTILTQYFAYQFGFDPSLGEPALAPLSALGTRGLYMLVAGGAFTSLGLAVYPQTRPYCGLGAWMGSLAFISTYGPLYVPYKGVLWLNSAIGQEQFAWMESHAVLVVGAALAFSLGCTLPIIALRGRPGTGSHGTAGWSEGKEMQKKKTGGGLILGRKNGNLLNYKPEGHLMTVAATRTGKGVGSVMPNLLSYSGSVLVTDIKGENYAVTKDYRSAPEEKGGLGQETIALDPFKVVENDPARFNPLDLLGPLSEEAGDDANMLAHMLVPEKKRGGNSAHFAGEARQFLAGLMLYVAGTEERGSKIRSLPYVRELLTLPSVKGGGEGAGEEAGSPYDASYYDTDYEDGERLKRAEPGKGKGKGIDACGRPMTFEALLRDMQRRTELFSGRVASAASQLSQKPHRERGGVISTAQQNTNFIETTRMKQSLCQSDFRFPQLKKGRASIYLVMPPHRLDAYRQWLRLMVSCAITAVARTPGKPDKQILFLLDEFANLGKMNPVKRAYSLMSGYGMSLWIFVQELPQLKDKYEDAWESFLSNADVFQAFGNSDPMTMKHVSRLAGDATIFVKSEGTSSGSTPGGTSTNRSENYSEKKRRLITPDEVRRLPEGKELVFVRGKNPVKADKIRYYEEKPFTGRARPNPMYADVGGDGPPPSGEISSGDEETGRASCLLSKTPDAPGEPGTSNAGAGFRVLEKERSGNGSMSTPEREQRSDDSLLDELHEDVTRTEEDADEKQ